MPEISRFLGIVITMFYQDHEPGHFHARYGDYRVSVRLADGLVTGAFPRRALRHVLEWYELHRDELEADWQRARLGESLVPIPPLE